MKYLQSVFVIIIIVIISSCRKDFTTVDNYGSLKFSQDTIFLDTVFTNIGSATYNLKVYNKSNKAITIPEITLENGVNSNYRLNVDGIPGQSFEDIDILANDSLYVFIETTIDYTSITDPIYTDRILFDNGNKQQNVDLVTLVQDAVFIYPNRDLITMQKDSIPLSDTANILGRYLNDSELNFTNEKPYVIYGYATVPTSKTLTIDAGAKIYFHDQSGIIVDKGASLIANGTLDNKVTFEGDRLEHNFNSIPGQWGTIWMRAGSKNNEINHAQIKNGVIGILVDSIGTVNEPTLKIANTEIYNNSAYGILGRETNIEANNIVIGSAGLSSFAGVIGGTYNFNHCTFANYWNAGIRPQPAVIINNFFSYEDDTGSQIIETRALKSANFSNCIIEGNNNIEFLLDIVDSGDSFNYNINNSLIQFNDVNESYTDINPLNFDDTSHYQNNIINGDPDFKDTFSPIKDFRIGQNSDAVNKATSSPITNDLLGIDRSTSPDIGAYQHIIFEE